METSGSTSIRAVAASASSTSRARRSRSTRRRRTCRRSAGPLPWSQGPRRMGTDKNGDVLWVGNSWGSTLARIDTKTLETKIIPFPSTTMQPYHIDVDKNHNVWGNLWTSDQIAKYDPASNKWTMFE